MIEPFAILADGDTGFYVHDATGELKFCMELKIFLVPALLQADIWISAGEGG